MSELNLYRSDEGKIFKVDYYNLAAILSVDDRVGSKAVSALPTTPS